jgi:hypothetical protein
MEFKERKTIPKNKTTLGEWRQRVRDINKHFRGSICLRVRMKLKKTERKELLLEVAMKIEKIMIERQRDRETERQRDRQTERHTYRKIQRDRETER